MNKTISLLVFCCLSLLQANTRVAFSRPASLIRTPGALDSEYFNQYVVGFGGEITQLNNLNYTFSNYFKGVTSTGYNYGISYTVSHEYMTEDIASDPPSNVSFHIHKQIFKRNNIGINFGIHDMLYTTEDPHRISLFTSFSYIQDMTNDYTLESVLGFGTGALTSDSHDYGDGSDDVEGEGPETPFFLGFKLRTPLLLDKGGLDFMFEYDGNGINVGTSIPLNSAWTINLALTNIGNIAKFGDWSSTGDLLPDATALGVGIQMNIPKLKYKKVTSSINNLSNIYNQIPYDESIDSLVRQATVLISSLEDSLEQHIQVQETLQSINQSLKQRINYLEDSLSMILLDDKIVELNLNQAMKHLSQSLAYYYNQNYKDALEETDRAIEIFPNLAIAYARKGSIYYRLGDEQRATVNWNIALTLDPEYDEVRTVLMSLQDNKDLKSAILPE